MKNTIIRMLNLFLRIGLFVLAFVLVVIFVLAIDEFVGTQRLYFLRTGNWGDLITITLFAIIVGWVLKRLLILQYKWGFNR